MEYHPASFEEFKATLESYKSVEEKISKLSREILNCKNALTDLKNNLQELFIIQIKCNSGNEGITELINNVLNEQRLENVLTKELFYIIGDKLFTPYNYFLEKAVSLREYYNTIRDVKPESNLAVNELIDQRRLNYFQSRIVWKSGIGKLLKLFYALSKNGILPSYRRDEILIHFIIEGEDHSIETTGELIPFRWLKSDCSFSIFVDELSSRGCINNRRKYKLFCNHFINKHGNRFKYLAQKKNYTENVTHNGSGKIIKGIFESVGIHNILLFLFTIMGTMYFL